MAEVKRWKKDNTDGELALATATDGNHGYGVAWISRQLNIKSFIYMPQVNWHLNQHLHFSMTASNNVTSGNVRFFILIGNSRI